MTSRALDELTAELTQLVAAPGPSGGEHAVADVVERLLGASALVVSRDALGTVRAVGGPARPRILVTAHLDQVGYMVSRVGADGVRCLPVGEPALASARAAVRVLAAPTACAAELDAPEDGAAVLRGVGVSDVRVGDRIVFSGVLERGTGARVRGPALDNRIGCLVALRAARILAAESEAVAFAWTVQEETTQAGVIRVARELEPDAVIAVDVTPATAESDSGSLVALGHGPVVTLLDGGMVGDAGLVRGFREAAEASGVAWQPEVVGDGISEAGHVQGTLGIPALALLVAIEDAHSPREAADLDDVRGAVNLLVAGVRRLLAGPARTRSPPA